LPDAGLGRRVKSGRRSWWPLALGCNITGAPIEPQDVFDGGQAHLKELCDLPLR
jgi:hypothetical protein